VTTLDSIQASIDALSAKADTIAAAATAQASAALRQAESSDRRTRALRLALVTACVVAAAVFAAVAWLAIDNRRANTENERAIAENNLKWCPLLAAIIQPDGPPPTTERGQVMVDLMSDLFISYGCTPADLPK
jgi:hypothetical protein